MKDDELIKHIVDEQAEDPDLWFIIGVRDRELKLQAALRRLHAAIEGCNESDT